MGLSSGPIAMQQTDKLQTGFNELERSLQRDESILRDVRMEMQCKMWEES